MPGYQNKVGAKVTRVQDTFNRGTLNPPGTLIWQHNPLVILPDVDPICVGKASCPNTSVLNLSAQQSGAGSTGTYWTTILPCVGLTYSALNGQQQYCQATFKGFQGTAFTACGNMVMATWNGEDSGQWYGIVHRNGGLTAVEKASVASSLLGNTILFTDVAPVIGDVWRLSFTPATNTLIATKNGVVVFNAVDSTSPLSGGIPGFNMRSVNQLAGVPGGVLVSNADCGLGL